MSWCGRYEAFLGCPGPVCFVKGQCVVSRAIWNVIVQRGTSRANVECQKPMWNVQIQCEISLASMECPGPVWNDEVQLYNVGGQCEFPGPVCTVQDQCEMLRASTQCLCLRLVCKGSVACSAPAWNAQGHHGVSKVSVSVKCDSTVWGVKC